MSECQAPDCTESEDLRAGMGEYCDGVCRNVAIKVAAEQMDQDDITDDVPEERVAEIREQVEEHHQMIQDELAE